jgi:predicted transcriptional regulator
MLSENYHLFLAAAYVRGWLQDTQTAVDAPIRGLVQKPFAELSKAEQETLLQEGIQRGLPELARFRIVEPAAIFQKILTLLNGIRPDNMLEVGFDYLQFTICWLQHFRYLSAAMTETDPRHLAVAYALQKGGMGFLQIQETTPENIFDNQQQFDVSVALDLHRKTDNLAQSFKNICKATKRFAIFTFPLYSLRRELPSEATIREWLATADMPYVKIEVADNRLLVVARK